MVREIAKGYKEREKKLEDVVWYWDVLACWRKVSATLSLEEIQPAMAFWFVEHVRNARRENKCARLGFGSM